MKPLTKLLQRAQHNVETADELNQNGVIDPWADVLDKSTCDGGSLRMPFTDKFVCIGKKKSLYERVKDGPTEKRGKKPVGIFQINLVAGEPGKCGLERVAVDKTDEQTPDSMRRTDLEWVKAGSIRVDVPGPSHIMLFGTLLLQAVSKRGRNIFFGAEVRRARFMIPLDIWPLWQPFLRCETPFPHGTLLFQAVSKRGRNIFFGAGVCRAGFLIPLDIWPLWQPFLRCETPFPHGTLLFQAVSKRGRNIFFGAEVCPAGFLIPLDIWPL